MLAILGITVPIFLLIAAGLASVRRGLLLAGETRGLGAFVINFALPALLFNAMAQRSTTSLVDVSLLTAYALGSLAVVVVAIATAWLALKRSLQSATVMALGMSLSNSAFMGFPIAQQLIGALGRLLRNPLIIAIVAGVAFSMAGLEMPAPVARVVELLSAASAPVALFYIGCVLAGISLKGMGADIGVVVLGKLVLHPLAVLGACMLVPLDDPPSRSALVLNAGMPMLSIYPILGRPYAKEDVCAAALVAATAVSFVTVNVLLWLTRAA